MKLKNTPKTGSNSPAPALVQADPAPDAARLTGLLLVLVTLLVYLPACFHDYIYFDDPQYVANNPMVQAGLTGAGLKWAFWGWHASNWHPLTWLSLMLDCQLVGPNPGAQHFINALLHAVNAGLMFVLWRRLTGAMWPSAVVAALFAWHPLHVESVAWIAERKDVLSVFFGLLASLAYVNYARSHGKSKATRRGAFHHYAWVLLWLALSLMSKPMLVTLPMVFLLLDFWPLGRMQPFTIKGFGRLIWEKVPLLVLSAVSCVMTFLAQRTEAVMSLQQRSLGLRVENAVMSCVDYLFKTFWPSDLAIIYPLPTRFGPTFFWGGLFLASLSALAWWSRRREPWLLVGWLWFLGTLVPVIGLVQVGNQADADRYTYWPLTGVFLMGAFAAQTTIAAKTRVGFATRAMVIVVLGLCVLATERQLAFWKNTMSLFAHTLAVTGPNPEAEMILGVAYERGQLVAEAVRHYEAALRLDDSLVVQMPDGGKRSLAVQTALLKAQAAELQGDRTKAVALYRAALAKDATLTEAHMNLANLLDDAGAEDEAMAHYKSAIELDPAAPLGHDNLGTLLVKLGRFEEAMKEYQVAAQLRPDDSRAFYLMGKAWLRQGRAAEAVAAFRQALAVDPNDVQASNWLAQVLADGHPLPTEPGGVPPAK